MPKVAKKHENTPKNAQKQQPNENEKNKNIKILAKGAQFLHLTCQGEARPLDPRQLRYWLV